MKCRYQRFTPRRRNSLLCGAVMLLLAALAFASPVGAQALATATIDSPGIEEVLKGVVSIRGTADAAAFSYAEVAFTYASELPETWFRISEIQQPIRDFELASWDTTSVTDGEYKLRLQVVTTEGAHQESIVPVQVRNYTTAPAVMPTPSPTRAPVVQVESPIIMVPSATATREHPRTPTPLPPNRVALTTTRVIRRILAIGVLSVIATFAAAALLHGRRR